MIDFTTCGVNKFKALVVNGNKIIIYGVIVICVPPVLRPTGLWYRWLLMSILEAKAERGKKVIRMNVSILQVRLTSCRTSPKRTIPATGQGSCTARNIRSWDINSGLGNKVKPSSWSNTTLVVSIPIKKQRGDVKSRLQLNCFSSQGRY